MKNNIDPLLIKELYEKYAKDVIVDDERVNKINKAYGEDNKLFIKEFYDKYAPEKELTDQKFEEISKVYNLKKNENQPQLSEESTTTSNNQPFDFIENREQKYTQDLQKYIQEDEVINGRINELQNEFSERVKNNEFQSEEEANNAFQRSVKEDKTIKAKELEYVKYVDEEFGKDVDAFQKIESSKQLDKQKADAEKNNPGVASSTLASFNRNFYGLAPDILDALGIGEKFINNYITSPLGIEDKIETLEDTGFGGIAEKARNTVEYMTPQADYNVDNKIVQTGGGLGQVASLIISGGSGNLAKATNLSKALKTGSGAKVAAQEFVKQVTSRTSAIASSQMSTYGYKRAVDEGATDGEAFIAALAEGAIGVTEAFPIAKAFERLDKITGGVVKRTIAGGFSGGLQEFTQEALQTYLSNLSAQQIYDSQTELIDGVLEAGEIGGYTGLVMSALISAIGGKRSKLNKSDSNYTEQVNQLNEIEEKLQNIKSEIEFKKNSAQEQLIIKAEDSDKNGINKDIEQTPTEENTQEIKPQTIDKLGKSKPVEVMEGGKSVNIDGTTIITTEEGDTITLESIKTSEASKGKGRAKNALKALTNQADADGKTIELKVVPEENTNTTVEGLEKLYKQAGFKKKGDKMVRSPKKPIVKNEDNSYTYENQKNQYNIKISEGILDITNTKTGEKVDQYKYKENKKGKKIKSYNSLYGDIRQEFEQSFDYSEGKTTQEADYEKTGISPDEVMSKQTNSPDNFVAEFSENPTEIAEQWKESRDSQQQGETISEVERKIADNLSKINPSDFDDYGDRNSRSSNIGKSYFAKQSESDQTIPLDIQAQDMSTQGVEVTPQDVYDFMIKYPNGVDQALNKRSEGQIALENKFREITGLPLDNNRVRIIEAQQKAQKLSDKAIEAIEKDGVTSENLETFKEELKDKDYKEEDYEAYKKENKPQSSDRADKVQESDGKNKSGEVKETKEGLIPDFDTLQEEVTTDKKYTSDYNKRAKATPGIGDYVKEVNDINNSKDEDKARKASKRIVDNAVKEGKLDELWEEYKNRVNNNTLPDIMFGRMAQYIAGAYIRSGQNNKTQEIVDFTSKGGTSASNKLNSLKSDASPMSAVSRVIAGLDSDKTEKVGGKEGLNQLYELKKELEATKEEVSEVRQSLQAEIDKLIDKIEKAGNEKKTLDSRIQDRKKAVKKVQNKLNSLKRNNDNQANDVVQVIGDKVWNGAIDVINNSLEAGLSLTNSIDKAIIYIKSKYKGSGFNEKAFENLIRLETISEPDINKSEKDIINKGLKDLNVKINDVISQHYTRREEIGTTLTQKLVQEANLPEKEAKILEDKLNEAFNEIVVDRQQKALAEKIGSNKIPIPESDKKIPKSRQRQIIEDINKGALSNDMFVNLFAEHYGFQKITPSSQKILLEFVDRIEALEAYPEMRTRAFLQMQDYMINEGMEKALAAEIILDMLYTGALSSPNTFFNALFGALNTSIPDIISTSLASPGVAGKALGRLFSSAFKNRATASQVMKDGISILDYKDFEPSKGGSGFVARLSKAKWKDAKIKKREGNTTKDKALNLLRPLSNTGKYIYKKMSFLNLRMYWTLLAQDSVVMFGLKDFHSHMIAYNEFTTKSATRRERLKQVNELLFIHKEKEFKIQAEKDKKALIKMGEKIPKGFINRRIVELREANMNVKLLEKATIAGKSNLLMNDPTGQSGWLFRGLSKITNPKSTDSGAEAAGRLIVNALFLIKRVPANFIDKSISYFPITGGLRFIRGTIKERGDAGSVTRKMTPQERREQLMKVAISSTIIGSLAAEVFDWDEEDGLVLNPESKIKIHGGGYGNYGDNLQIAKDFRPFTIQIGDYFIPYQYSPFGATIAPLGVISDEIRLKDFNKIKRNKGFEIEKRDFSYMVQVAIGSGAAFLTAQSYQQQLKEVINFVEAIFSGDTDKRDESISRVTSRPIKTIAVSNLYTYAYSAFKSLNEIPEKQKRKLIDYYIDDIPGLENFIPNAMYDVFGYPVIKPLNIPIWGLMSDYRDASPQHKFILSYNQIKAGSFRAQNYIDKQKLDDEQKNEYERMAGEEFRDLLNEDVIEMLEDNYIKVDKEEQNLPYVQNYIDDLRTTARARAKTKWKEIYYDYDKVY